MISATRTVASYEEWFQINRIVEMYEKTLDMLEEDLNFDDVQETYFSQNVDNGKFETEIYATRQLGGHGVRGMGSNTDFVLFINYYTRSPVKDTPEGYSGLVTLECDAKLEVEMPGKDRWLDSVLRRIWFTNIYRRQFRYWVEFVEEEMRRYINQVRNFFGFEPTVVKTRRLNYEPLEHTL